MRHYQNNAKWLMWSAPFRALSVSSGYLMPFYLQHGMSQSSIFVLQSIYSLSYFLWEIPSGWLADKIGRARCIKLSVPFAVVSMIAYGFSDHYWQFVICELLLALASGLVSGADKALLLDSLKADKREGEYVRITQKISSYGFSAVAIGVPLSILLVKYVSIEATMVADGLLTAVGGIFSFKLVEPPVHATDELDGSSAWEASKLLMSNRECRWLVAMTVTLSCSTYFAAWLAAPYYLSIGIPILWFGAIEAICSLFKAWLGHRFHRERHIKLLMFTFVVLARLPYLLMATGYVWLAFAVLGHDVVQALHPAPISRRYNDYISSRHRATLNSVIGMQQRLAFGLLGPLVGLTVDRLGLSTGLVILGLSFSSLAAIAFQRLLVIGSFQKGR